MRRRFGWLMGYFALLGSAAAQTVGQPMVSLGYCQLTSLGSSTGLASCSGGVPAGANAVILRAEAQALRYRTDGVTTAPTSSVGMPILIADEPLFLQGGRLSLTNLRFIEQTSGGKLNVTFYRAPQ
jgi:hypothetical protein